MPKNLTLRLADEQAEMLEVIAREAGQTLTDVVRKSIDAQIEEARNDEAFMRRLRERHEREKELFDLLAE